MSCISYYSHYKKYEQVTLLKVDATTKLERYEKGVSLLELRTFSMVNN